MVETSEPNSETNSMAEINPQELLGFIARAHRNTYAAPPEIRKQHRCETPLLPGHKDYEYVDGLWRYRDSYAGEIIAPGSEVVFYNDRPVWRMSYQGMPNEKLPREWYQNQVFPFLKKALIAADEKCPFRGLDGFKDGLFTYYFRISGDYYYFHGKECITEGNGHDVFFQDVIGSIIK